MHPSQGQHLICKTVISAGLILRSKDMPEVQIPEYAKTVVEIDIDKIPVFCHLIRRMILIAPVLESASVDIHEHRHAAVSIRGIDIQIQTVFPEMILRLRFWSGREWCRDLRRFLSESRAVQHAVPAAHLRSPEARCFPVRDSFKRGKSSFHFP